jgi:phosphatidylglycerol---prolipoprotein diacylglyceryl transferase
MKPVLNIFGFEIASYSLFLFLALFFVFFGSYFFLTWNGQKKSDVLYMLGAMSVFAFIGARALNFFVNYSFYKADFAKLFEFSSHGFSLYGGVLGAIFAGYFIAKLRKIELFRFADLMTPFVGIGIILMRIGCFLNGCCFGKKTDFIFGVKFPDFSQAHLKQISGSLFSGGTVKAVHPTQIYEAVFVFLCVLLAFYLIFKKKKFASGSVFLISGALFSAFRWVNMYFRDLNYSDLIIDIVYPIIYLGVIFSCIFLSILLNRKK